MRFLETEKKMCTSCMLIKSNILRAKNNYTSWREKWKSFSIAKGEQKLTIFTASNRGLRTAKLLLFFLFLFFFSLRHKPNTDEWTDKRMDEQESWGKGRSSTLSLLFSVFLQTDRERKGRERCTIDYFSYSRPPALLLLTCFILLHKAQMTTRLTR